MRTTALWSKEDEALTIVQAAREVRMRPSAIENLVRNRWLPTTRDSEQRHRIDRSVLLKHYGRVVAPVLTAVQDIEPRYIRVDSAAETAAVAALRACGVLR